MNPMNPSELPRAADTPRKVLARLNTGEMVWVELNRALNDAEKRCLEAENGFRFFDRSTEAEQSEMTQFMIAELVAGRSPNPHL